MINNFLKISALTLIMLVVSPVVLAIPTIEALALFADRAMLGIGEHQYLLKTGDTSPEGVKLISASSKNAIVEYEGRQYTIESKTVIHGEIKPPEPIKVIIEQPTAPTATVTIAPTAAKNTMAEVVISADINDQYITTASINGRDVKAIIDTGANTVAISSKQAKLLDIDVAQAGGLVGTAQTASGSTTMTMVKLSSIKIGNIEVKNVDAAVLDGNAPEVVLLGMTFLNQVHLTHEKGVMKITQKNQTTTPTPAITMQPQN
jgi:aspartyl protease family protein